MRRLVAVLVVAGLLGCTSFGASESTADGGVASDSGVPSEAGDSAATIGDYASAVALDAPLAYWRMDNNGEGAGLYDEVARKASGQRVGGATFSREGALGPGIGAALAFDHGAVQLGQRFAFSGEERFTIELWVRRMDLSTGHIFTKLDFASPKSGYALYVDASRLTFERFVNNEGNEIEAEVTPGAYHHVAAVYDGESLALYIDGASVVKGSAGPPVLPATTSDLLIGARSPGLDQPLAGSIDELAVYGKVLAPDRIAAHFHAAGR